MEKKVVRQNGNFQSLQVNRIPDITGKEYVKLGTVKNIYDNFVLHLRKCALALKSP